MSERTKALLAILVAALLWGSAGVTAKLLLAELSPFVILFYRFVIASLVMLPLFLRAKKPKRYLQTLIPLSMLSFGNALLFYMGIERTTSNAAYIINATTPLVTAALARIFIGERTNGKKLVGITIGLIGALFIVLLPLWNKGVGIYGDFVGNMFVTMALLCWTSYTVGNRHFAALGTYSPTILVSMNFFTTALMSGTAAFVTGQQFITPGVFRPAYILLLLYVAIPVTVVTFGFFQWAAKHVTATSASLKDYVQLVVAFGLNGLILGERITLPYIVGSVLVVLGVLIATGSRVTEKLAALRAKHGDN